MGEVISTGTCLEGVKIEPLTQIRDERGMVMHMLRADSPLFQLFGEVYFSLVKAGIVKAWKRHKVMTQNFAVPVGNIKLVLYDVRHGSQTQGKLQEIMVGVDHYGLIQIPPGLWYGFQGIKKDALIANCSTHAHDPAEVERIEVANDIVPYSW